MVKVLIAFDTGVLCWIDFIRNSGTTTVSGSAPSAMPKSAVPGFVIADWAIVPNLVPSYSMSTSTFTDGDVCALAGFIKLNDALYAVPDTVPPAAVVSTSCPELCVQTPRVPKRSNVDVTCSVDVSNVCDPVSPEMVTVDPLARS